jgi:hypothetical protein
MSRRKKNWSRVPDGHLTPKRTGRLIIGRNVILTWLWYGIVNNMQQYRRAMVSNWSTSEFYAKGQLFSSMRSLSFGGLELRVIVLVRPRSNCTSKLQTHPLVREGAQQQETHICHAENKNLVMGFRWSSVQSSWLQIQRFDFRSYQIFWEVVGLERGSLSLASTTKKLLERKSRCYGLEIRDYGRRGSAALTTRHLSFRKSWR